MYRINVSEKDMKQIKTVSLAQEGFKEQGDLQEWIAKHPECLCSDDDDELLIIQKEFSTWDDQSQRRLDLLALDKQGNLVVIENKRDDSSYNVVAQAITYASFCETMIAERIIDEYSHYMSKYKESGDAQKKICEFLGKKEIQEIKDIINRQQRIIIVAGDFPIEVTSAVLWLRNNYNLKIDCVCYHLYRDGETRYIDFDKIIPIAGAEDYQIRLTEKRQEENEARSHKCVPEYRDYWIKVNSYLEKHKELIEKGFTTKYPWAERGEQWFQFKINRPYFFRLTLYKDDGKVGVSVLIDTKDKKGSDFYDQLSEQKKQRIEKTLGGKNVVRRENNTKTISTTTTWNRDEPEKSIEWQMNTLVAVMKVLDEVSK